MSAVGEVQLTPRKKPFNLCFTPKKLIGKSDIHKGLIDYGGSIDIKFYAKHERDIDVDEKEIEEKLKKMEQKGPREVYHEPVTQNQRYGWYQVIFTDMDRSDRRLNHAKRTNPLVKEHLMNYAKIRE